MNTGSKWRVFANRNDEKRVDPMTTPPDKMIIRVDSTPPEFRAFAKIARLNREVVVTEKIDGTNGLIWISDDLSTVKAGSRSRWITPDNDNHGFAKWVYEHADELKQLTPGCHYGEWWGSGIQRGYGLKEKRFSLFNVLRWETERPACCHVVPVLARGADIRSETETAIAALRVGGSVAAPGFARPEGVVIFHSASGTKFKVTLENDDAPKGRP